MGQMQNIRSHIKSIESTQQITQSMRLVSSSKVHTARRHMESSQPFFQHMIKNVQSLVSGFPGSQHRYLQPREVKTSGIIAIASDRGLCGGYNVSIVRETRELIESLPADYKLITVGTQLWDRFRRQDILIEQGFHGISEKPYFEDAKEIAEIALAMYDLGEIDEIYLVHTQFVTMISQQTAVAKVLPIPMEQTDSLEDVYCEPSVGAVLDSIIPMYVSAYLYGAMAESSVCEQSARIVSMDAATRNSQEMIEQLTLEYNKARQAAITQELTEIVSGANALEEEE